MVRVDRAGRLASIVLMLLWAVAAGADIGPKKPSEVVDVALTLGSGACTNTGTKFDTVLAPDGSQTAFTIPEKRVLVVTAIELLGFGATPGALVQTRIFRGVGLSVNGVAIRESAADAGGRIFHTYQFDPGVVVASGGEVCTNNNLGITTTGTLRGYLTKDK
jgi:hypothetical protein